MFLLLRASRARLVTAAEATRRRIERNLHDGAQQHLALVSMKLALLGRRAGDRAGVAAAVEGMRRELAVALDELRRLAHGIYPAALEHDGLVGAVQVAGTQSLVPVIVDAPDDLTRWPRDVESALYFCCWELLRDAEEPVSLTLSEANGRGSFSISATRPTEDAATALFLEDRIGSVGGDVVVTIAADRIVAEGQVRVR